MDLARRIANLSPKQRELLESKLKERNIDVSQISRLSGATGLKQQDKIGYAALKPMEKKEYYPLSSVQRRLYFLWQFDEKKNAYNISCRLVIENTIDKVRLEDAFRRLIKRHETLRMSVEVMAGELIQRIHDQVEFAIEYWEQNVNGKWSSGSSTYPACSPGSIINGFNRPFDLYGAPLLRSGLIKLAKEKYILIVDMHHIITDGTSFNLFIKEWSDLYTGKQLPPLKLQYKDYSEWQTSEEQKKTIERQGKYWIKQLEGEIPGLELPYDYPRPELQDFEGDTVVAELPGEDTRGISELAIREKVTFYMVLLAVVTVWLSKLSNQEEILVGTPIASRRCVDLENIIGMFVNTVVIKNKVKGTKTFREFLKEVKKTTLQAFENQEYPFEELVEKLVANRKPGRNPLFDVMFTLQNMNPREIDIPGMKITLHNEQQNTAKFDIIIQCFEIDGMLRCNFEYSTKLFKRATIKRFVNYFKKLIAAAIETPGVKIADIEIITDKEKKQVLFAFNDTGAAYPGEMTIHEWFAAQVVKTPDHIASVFAGQQLSYRTLDSRANQLARLLKEKGVKPDTIVGIMVKRSLEMLIGIMGIWKAGGAYLTIDTQYPLERKKYMLMNSGVRLLLINYTGESLGCIPVGIEVLDLREKHIYQGETSELNRVSQCTDLVYVIYTSGSMGNPKGVLLQHRNLVNLLDFQFKCTNIDCSKILQFATLCFDASFHEIFSALLSGGTIFLVSENTRTDIPELFKVIEKNRIRTLFLPISFLKIIFSEENYIKLIPGCITHIQTAGEQVVISNNFRKYLRDTNVSLHNHYGPSETHVVTTLTIDPRGNIPGLPSIGKPVANTRIYIMDKYAHLLPVGIPGELYIGGIQVGRGYLNRPELTSEKYINYKLQNTRPLSIKKAGAETNTNYNVQNYKTSGIHTIMQSCNHASIPSPHYPIYITGDLARWLNDGNIEFLGRIDHQVKIRGFRVELGEIEKQLLNHSKVKEAVVELKTDENGDKYLCAYVVPDRAQGAGSQELEQRKNGGDGLSALRNYLSRKLPDYMIPAHFVFLENIPLTPNGKVDRKSLPKPCLEISKSYIGPGNKLETKLVEIWSEVLALEKEKISIDANFFQLGGHSLKVTLMVAKIHKKLNVEVPLTGVFKTPTIRGLGGYITGLAEDKYVTIKPMEQKEYYTLSSAQKRLYILQQMDLQSKAYNIPYFFHLMGQVDVLQLEDTFKKMIHRHESLRTSFILIEEEPVQQVHDQVEFEIEYKEVEVEVKVEEEKERASLLEGTRRLAPLWIPGDGGSLPAAGGWQPAASTIKNFIRSFALSQAPLLRVGLIKLLHTPAALSGCPSQEGIEGKYLLLVDMHHIISDGVSIGILMKDLAAFYCEEELASPRIQYKDFAQWQYSQEVQESIKQQEAYWLKEFSGKIPMLDLPMDFNRPQIQNFTGSNLHFEISKNETTTLKAYALERETTLFTILFTIYNVFLFKISSQEDIVVGSPISGRVHNDLEDIVGMFVNTLALRNFPSGDKNFNHLLGETRWRTLEAFENQDYPHEELVEKVVLSREPGRNPLFDVMFVLQNLDMPVIEIYGLKISPFNFLSGISKFDLTLQCIEIDDALQCSFEYSTKLFKADTIQRLINYFKKVISIVIENPAIKISDMEIISVEDKRQLLYDFNDTRTGYPKEKTIHHLFEEQVENAPAHTVVTVQIENSNLQLTYNELNKKANQLAGFLEVKGVQADALVGIMVERSMEMVVGILGILKAGGAYLPISPGYPQERIDLILKDSRLGILVTTLKPQFKAEVKETRKHPLEVPLQSINIDKDFFHFSKSAPSTLTSTCQVSPANLAYINYTSGSSGQPKGVMVEHLNVIRLVKNNNYIKLREDDRILQTGALEFDASTFEIWGSLLNGLGLYLVSNDVILTAETLKETIQKNAITTMWLTSPLFNRLLDADIEIFRDLKNLLVGGDILSPLHINRLRAAFPWLKIINGYGPTENTTFSTTYLVDKEYKKNIPIGRPIANSTVYIIDKYNHLLPVGIPGELIVGGDGVARGYMNQPGLTSEKFLPDFHGSYIYCTGDLARWLPDRNIEFLGRIDHQVKIRGFRVEPGEIESQLLAHEKVKSAAVADKTDDRGDKCLCAYVVIKKEVGKAAISELQLFLSGKLPDYMVPVYFVFLDSIPLTPNGKLDRKSLPDPEIQAGKGYIAPRTNLEKKLVDIWSEVLNLERENISIDANFFELGGHSLKATMMVAKIAKDINAKLPLAEVFKTPNIKGLSAYIQTQGKRKFQSINPTEKKDYYVLSSAQQRLYILQQMDLQCTAYNIPYFFHLLGQVDVLRLQNTFKKMIHRHESLRNSFTLIEEEPVQQVHDQVEFEIEYKEVEVKVKVEEEKERSSLLEGTRGLAPLWIPGAGGSHPAAGGWQPAAGMIKNFIRPFDLSQAPLLRVGLIKLLYTSAALRGHSSQEGIEGQYLLLVDIHHIISDGVSIGILINDIGAFYREKELTGPRIQYKDFAQWQHSQEVQELIKPQEEYWLNEFIGEIPMLDLPIDFTRPLVQDFAGSVLHFEIGKNETTTLNTYALERRTTLFTILLTIYNIFLFKITSQEDIVVGTPIAGRVHSNLANIMGMFVNTLALRNYPAGEKNFNQLLGEIQWRTLEAFENQDYPYEELVKKVVVDREPGRNPLFDVMFVLQNLDLPTIEIPGLKMIPCNYQSGISKFDLILQCIEIGQNLQCSFEYSTKLLKADTIRRLIHYFKKVISIVIENPAVKILAMEIITAKEKRQVLYDFNDTQTPYPKDKTLHALFVEQVEQTPDHIALVGPILQCHCPKKGQDPYYQLQKTNYKQNGVMHINYRELNEKSNQLALLLSEKNVRPDTIVGIMVERSMEMVIGILGILKVGAAYLPIDPGYPQERIDLMLKDSQTQVLLSGDPSWASRLSFALEALLNLSAVQPFYCQLSTSSPQEYHHDSSSIIHHSSNLAYVIYTSGSTGKPKGTLINHQSVVNLCYWHHRYYEVTEKDRAAQYASFGFDASVWEIFPYLLKGASLYIIPDRIKLDPRELIDYYRQHYISIGFLPTRFCQQITEEETDFPSLRALLTGGDKLDRFLKRKYPLYNNYGPTENTVVTTSFLVENTCDNIPVGKPTANNRVYILDKRNYQPQPLGVPGELCTAGDGLSRGYLNNPELTAEKFQFPNKPAYYRSYRFYKTGDLARWLPDGNIEFLGRIDYQVKIRGFRIELGEIENRLLACKGVTEVVVSAREDRTGCHYLCAYVVLEPGRQLKPEQLRNHLSRKLPGYMIPAFFVSLDNIPLTPNGKPDRKSLPAPGIVSGSDYAVPTSRIEKKLLEIWTGVLALDMLNQSPSLPSIGIDNNFFELGGNSLKAVALVSRVHKELNTRIPLVQMFKSPTIRELAAQIDSADAKPFEPITPVEQKEYYDVSNAQKRVWVVSQVQEASISFNIPMAQQLEGTLHLQALEKTFQALVQRHESLRTVFITVNGEVKQKILPLTEPVVNLEYLELNDREGDTDASKEDSTWKQLDRASRLPFDLSTGPLLRVILIRLEPEKFVLFLNIHHITSDFLSMGILFHEMIGMYEAFADRKENPFPPLHVQYKDYAAWHHKQLNGKQFQQHREYWLKRLKGHPVRLELPADKKRPVVQTYNGAGITITIEETLFEKLKVFSAKQDVTLFMTLLTMLNVLFYHYTGQGDIVLGMVSAGREHADLQHQVGYYLNTLVLRTCFSAMDTFIGVLKNVREVLTGAYQHQAFPFDCLVEETGHERNISRHPFFDVLVDMLNYNQPGHFTARAGSRKSRHIRISDFATFRGAAKFDLAIYFFEGHHTLTISFQYNTDIFENKTIERMLNRFKILLETALAEPESPVSRWRLEQKHALQGIQALSREK